MFNWYLGLLLLFMCFLMTGCLSEDDQKRLADEGAKYKTLKQEIGQLIEDAQFGKITIPEMSALIEAKKLQMESTLEIMKDINSRGNPWWEIMLWSILGAAGVRGIPSKGPIRGLIDAVIGKKEDKKGT